MRHLFLLTGIIGFLLSCAKSNHSEKESKFHPKDSIQRDTLSANKMKSVPVKAKVTLTIQAQKISGDLGQITFSQNNKTLFYYKPYHKKGKIILNGTSYTINNYFVDQKTNSYHLSGDQLEIKALNCTYKTNEGEDCGYGKFPIVIITLGTDSLKITNVDLQNCPSY